MALPITRRSTFSGRHPVGNKNNSQGKSTEHGEAVDFTEKHGRANEHKGKLVGMFRGRSKRHLIMKKPGQKARGPTGSPSVDVHANFPALLLFSPVAIPRSIVAGIARSIRDELEIE